ncbi:MAG: IS21-like element helper ATPase IstB [Pseudomonadota bacterium]
MENNITQEIISYSKELRLPTFRKNYESAALEAACENLSFEQYLHGLLQQEYEARAENRKKTRIRQAGFPQLKYLQDLSREELPSEAFERLPLLERLDFIREGRNLILAGNPGTGKTHLALGLGIKACSEGFRVLFTTVPRMLTQIRENRSEKKLSKLEQQFEKYDLVICDEFGYISYDKEGAELLFNHLSLRAGHKSTIITTNLSFDRWPEIFGDPTLTAAMVDRLTHLAFLINMNGKSYRVKETRKWNCQ